jgi:hypothetical protein
MTDRWTDTELTARLQSAWTSEVTRAHADYQAIPRRAGTRLQFTVPGAVIAVAISVLALAILLRGVVGLPPTGSNSIQMGDDGLPVAIGGQTVLRGGQITQWLADPSAAGGILAGGRLVVEGTGCAIAATDTPCIEAWQLVAPTSNGPSFPLVGLGDAPGFVRTSGALTVLHVDRRACRSVPCPDALTVSDVAWRAATKGRIPPNASSNQGATYDALWPDFVGTYGTDGETIAGFIAKADLLGPIDGPLPVYGEDLSTLVGYQVPDRGFVPISEYQASAASAPPVDATPFEVLTAYLEAVQARNCPAALIVSLSGDIVPTTNALCSSSARVTAFAVDANATQPSEGTEVFHVAMTTTGGAFGLPDGQNPWFFALARQPSGAWRVSAGVPLSPESSSALPMGGISQSAAEAAAVQAVGRSRFAAVHAVAGRAGDVIPDGMPFPDLPSDETMVWFITLSDGGPPLGAQGADVVVDYFDGTIYGFQFWIS